MEICYFKYIFFSSRIMFVPNPEGHRVRKELKLGFFFLKSFLPVLLASQKRVVLVALGGHP